MKRKPRAPRHIGYGIATDDDPPYRWHVTRPDGSVLDERYDSIGHALQALEQEASNDRQ